MTTGQVLLSELCMINLFVLKTAFAFVFLSSQRLGLGRWA